MASSQGQTSNFVQSPLRPAEPSGRDHGTIQLSVVSLHSVNTAERRTNEQTKSSISSRRPPSRGPKKPTPKLNMRLCDPLLRPAWLQLGLGLFCGLLALCLMIGGVASGSVVGRRSTDRRNFGAVYAGIAFLIIAVILHIVFAFHFQYIRRNYKRLNDVPDEVLPIRTTAQESFVADNSAFVRDEAHPTMHTNDSIQTSRQGVCNFTPQNHLNRTDQFNSAAPRQPPNWNAHKSPQYGRGITQTYPEKPHAQNMTGYTSSYSIRPQLHAVGFNEKAQHSYQEAAASERKTYNQGMGYNTSGSMVHEVPGRTTELKSYAPVEQSSGPLQGGRVTNNFDPSREKVGACNAQRLEQRSAVDMRTAHEAVKRCDRPPPTYLGGSEHSSPPPSYRTSDDSSTSGNSRSMLTLSQQRAIMERRQQRLLTAKERSSVEFKADVHGHG